MGKKKRSVTLLTLDRIEKLFIDNPKKIFSKTKISENLGVDPRSVDICLDRLLLSNKIIPLKNGGRTLWKKRK